MLTFMFLRDYSWCTEVPQLELSTMLFGYVIVVYFGIFIDSAFSVFKVCPAGMYLQWSDCYLCHPGTYQDATGQNSCVQCPAGTYSATPGATFCALCKVGTYQPLVGQWACFSCASSQTTYRAGSTSDGDCVTECNAGTYRINRNSDCKQCPLGSYQPNEGHNSCLPCIAGTYQNRSGQTSCIQCPPGSYQSSSGSESCISCIPGTYQQNAGSSSQCLVCPVGTYQESVGAVSCNKCVVGMFQNQTGQTKCDPCPEGTYQSSEGANECIACAPGMYQNFAGQSRCIDCPVGSYKAESGPGPCIPCGVGTYQNRSGKVSCSECLNGTSTTGVGTKSIKECIVLECNAGTYRLNQSSICHKCPSGSYQPISGQTSCLPCIIGTYQNQSGQISCISCSVGTFQNQTGQIKCDPCPEGTYQSSEGANECIACAPGMYQNFAGQSRCIDCPVGSYKAESGPGLCIPCGVGTYQNRSGKISCSECLNGTSTTGVEIKSIKECIVLDTPNTTNNTIDKDLELGGRLTIIIISITLPVTAIVIVVIAITYRRRKAANKAYESTSGRVQLEEHYSTLEDIGLECTSKGRDEYRIPRGKFVQTYKTLMEIDLKSGKSKLLLNFEKFTSRTRLEFVSGPYENTSLISETGGVISIYSLGERGRSCIVTTLPVLSTEFWSCVIENKIGSIIALGDNEERGTCLGKTTNIQCKQFRIEGTNTKVSSGMRFLQLQVSYGENFEVKKTVIYVTINLGLDEERIPADIRKLVITYVRSVRSMNGKQNQSILIHTKGCNVEQVGRLYNVFSVLHHLDETEFFDLELSLKIARIQGVFRVDSFEKYKFLHDVVCQYILYS